MLEYCLTRGIGILRTELSATESLEKDEIVDVHVNDAPVGISVEEQIDNRRLPGETGMIDCKGFLRVLSKIGMKDRLWLNLFMID